MEHSRTTEAHMSDSLLEERYKQLETNFKAIVAELKRRPSSARQQSSLEVLLSKLEADLRHALLRGQASNMDARTRLEERTQILQRNFTRVVELMGEPSSPSVAPPAAGGGVTTPGGNGEGARSRVSSGSATAAPSPLSSPFATGSDGGRASPREKVFVRPAADRAAQQVLHIDLVGVVRLRLPAAGDLAVVDDPRVIFGERPRTVGRTVRLVAHTPHDDTRMIAVAANHLDDVLPLHFVGELEVLDVRHFLADEQAILVAQTVEHRVLRIVTRSQEVVVQVEADVL